MTPRADTRATRHAIVTAAEQLFATHGIDAVSQGQICRAAGQRNHSAVKYHFGDKRAILRAILDRHAPMIDARRIELLDALAEGPSPALRDLVRVLVEPVAEKLDESDSGRAFVLISAQLVGHPTHALIAFDQEAALEGRQRLAMQIAAHLPQLPFEVLMARRGLILSLLFHGLADHALQPMSAPIPRAVFVANLVDILVAVLSAPASEITRSLTMDPAP